MTTNMRIELFFAGGGCIDKDITYQGNSWEEIAQDIDRDNKELMEYMRTHDDKGSKAFCFAGFSFEKQGLIAAQMKDSIF